MNPPNSVTEATTRILETSPPHTAMPPQFDPQPRGMAYQPPAQTPSGPSATTRSLEPVKHKQPRHRLFASLLVIALMALMSLTLTRVFWRRPPAGGMIRPPTISLPPRPPGPPFPSHPPASAPGAATMNFDLIYPGAQTTMDFTSAREGRVLQLRTPDSLDKVTDWYTDKLKPIKIIKVPGSNVVMEASGMKAIITAGGDGTNILLKQDADRY